MRPTRNEKVQMTKNKTDEAMKGVNITYFIHYFQRHWLFSSSMWRELAFLMLMKYNWKSRYKVKI